MLLLLLLLLLLLPLPLPLPLRLLLPAGGRDEEAPRPVIFCGNKWTHPGSKKSP
jgi:hypothetical protein